jgi:hypothetical protein
MMILQSFAPGLTRRTSRKLACVSIDSFRAVELWVMLTRLEYPM